MIEIDYKITFQDDLDASETNLEYSFNRPWIKWIIVRGFSSGLILISLYSIISGIIESSDPDANLAIGLGIFGIILGIIFPLLLQPNLAQSFLARSSTKKEWSKKYNLEESRNITITEKEFVFKTENSEIAWNWQSVKSFVESNKGFLVWFYSGQTRYIPKRIFTNSENLNHFRSILESNH